MNEPNVGEQQEEQGPVIQTSPLLSPIHQYGSSILLLTNPENELNKMELMFRSMRLDKDGNPVSAGDPLMNDFGVHSVLGTIQSVVNQVTVMSNLNKMEIPMLMDFLGDTLAKDLMMNKTEYGIKSVASRDKIFFTALTTSFITMKRAFEEGDKRFWKGSVQEITSRVEQTGRKSGILSALNPWNK